MSYQGVLIGFCVTLALLVSKTQQRVVDTVVPPKCKAVVNLIGGTEESGAVELTYVCPGLNITGLVCDDYWDYKDGEVVCRMLGFEGVMKVHGQNRNFFNYQKYDVGFLMDDVRCLGTEKSLTQCKSAAAHRRDCVNRQGRGRRKGKVEAAGVECVPKHCLTTVRLVDSPLGQPLTGTVELTHRCQTGYVCDDWWDLRDGHVVCRMLGYPGARKVYKKNYFKNDKSSGLSIVMDDLRCKGNENKLPDCRHRTYLKHNCAHSELAGVTCQKKPSGWISYSADRLYYQVFDEQLSYFDAKKKCEKEGGTLPKPMNFDENDFLASLTKKNFWIGIKREDEKWLYDEGDPLQWSNWGDGQPGRGKQNNFAFINMTSQLMLHKHLNITTPHNRLKHGLDQKWGNIRHRKSDDVPVTLCQKGCRIGWVFDLQTSTCYRIHNKQESFYEARAHCESQCGQLPMPKTEQGNNFFGRLTDASFWLGVSDDVSEGQWRWNDGERVKWANWDKQAPVQPDGGKKENCAVMKAGPGTTWDDVDCTGGVNMESAGNIVCTYKRAEKCLAGQYGRCCEKDCDCINEREVCHRWTGECRSGKKYCPRGWGFLDASQRCYRYFNEATDYFGARKKCEEVGGMSSLAMPKTEEIHAYLVQISRPISRGWIGLDDWHQEGTFVWDDGEELTGWVKWLLKNDNDHGRGHCCEIKSNIWNDRLCHEPLKGFFCEIAPFETYTCSDVPKYKDLDGQVWKSCKEFLTTKGSYLCMSSRVRRACCDSCKKLQLPGLSESIKYDPEYTDQYTFDLLVIVDHKNVERYKRDYKEKHGYELSENGAKFLLHHHIEDNTLTYARKGFARYNITMKVAGFVLLDHNFVNVTGWKAGVAIQIPPFRDWMIENNMWEKYKFDVAIIYSGYEPVIASGWSSTTICKRQGSWSLVGGYRGYNQNYLTMHELGHNLGAGHQTLGWMGRWNGNEYYTEENVRNIRRKLRKNWNGTLDIELGYNRHPWGNCIRDTNPVEVVVNENDNLPASQKTPDQLCANSYGNSSYMCRVPMFYSELPPTGDQLCRHLHCVIGDFHWECHQLDDVIKYTEGMACATGKICQGGACKPKSTSYNQLIDESCPFGDQAVVTDKDFGNMSCSETIDLYGDAVCAGDFPFEGFKHVCCDSCKIPQGNGTCPTKDGVFPKTNGNHLTCDQHMGPTDDENNACPCYKENFHKFCCNACKRRKLPDTKLRLVGGTERSGSLEVTHQCVTGIVCDNFWDLKDGEVACRMLGFPGAVRVYNKDQNHFNYSNRSAEYIFDEMQCKANDTDLSKCKNRGFMKHRCINNKNRVEVAGVECLPKECETSVKLVGGPDDRSGTVMLSYKCETGVICDDLWDINDGNVVCRMMGFPGADRVYMRNHFGYSNHSTAFLLDDVRCNGNEPNLSHCTHFGFKRSDCHNSEHKSEVAGVKCTAK